MTEKHYVIPHSLVAGLLSYLQTRPYQEVAQAIPALMKLPEASLSDDQKQQSYKLQGDWSVE